jgi:hypothetical protein
VYTTSCMAAGQNASYCACYLPSGQTSYYMEPIDPFKACYLAAQSCNSAR